jgi:hypothetical protein
MTFIFTQIKLTLERCRQTRQTEIRIYITEAKEEEK